MRAKDMIPLARGPADFMAMWSEICHEGDRKEDEWIARLRADGVKAAHPDDGWVDRKKNTVHFAYPNFNDGAKIGDRIALGDPEEFRIVTITGSADGLFLERWAFKATKTKGGNKP